MDTFSGTLSTATRVAQLQAGRTLVVRAGAVPCQAHEDGSVRAWEAQASASPVRLERKVLSAHETLAGRLLTVVILVCLEEV